jgi:hypothetical protein
MSTAAAAPRSPRTWELPYTPGMRTWIKVTLADVVLVAVVVLAPAGVGAYFVLRHPDTSSASETAALREIEAVRARFGARPPLVEIRALTETITVDSTSPAIGVRGGVPGGVVGGVVGGLPSAPPSPSAQARAGYADGLMPYPRYMPPPPETVRATF